MELVWMASVFVIQTFKARLVQYLRNALQIATETANAKQVNAIAILNSSESLVAWMFPSPSQYQPSRWWAIQAREIAIQCVPSMEDVCTSGASLDAFAEKVIGVLRAATTDLNQAVMQLMLPRPTPLPLVHLPLLLVVETKLPMLLRPTLERQQLICWQ
jgi:hypothetical protein